MATLITGTFDSHVMEEVFEARSFRFTNVRVKRSMDIVAPGCTIQRVSMERTRAYSFGLTWRPGHLILTGDLGELTLVHYHALGTLKSINWALSSDHDYLMGKTNVRKEYDPDETLCEIKNDLNRPLIEFLNGERIERDIWPKPHEGQPTQGPIRHYVRRIPGFRHELQDWRRQRTKAMQMEMADIGCADEYLYDRPELPLVTERKDRWSTGSVIPQHRKVSDDYNIPDHLEAWARAAYAVHENANKVNTREGRADVWYEIERAVSDERSEAIEFLQRAGFDDYYGSEKWPDHTYWQIAAIQHGIAMIYLNEFPDSEEASRIRGEQRPGR